MKRVLIADDEYFEREALKMIFSDNTLGYHITAEVDNGQKAVDAMLNNEADVVILDIQMPVMTGIEAAKLIRDHRPDAVIIMLTAYSEFDLVHRALKLHVDDYLLKPCRPEAIFEALEAAASAKKEVKVALKAPEDFKTTLRRAFISGDYIETKRCLDEVLHRDHMSLEEGISDMKEILGLTNQVADHFKIDLNKSAYTSLMQRIKGAARKDEYIALIDDLVEALFDSIIADKLAHMPKEMDYALQFIEKHIDERMTLEDVASYMNISPHYFSKLFKQEVGINFIDYMTERKIARAKALMLRTDEPINNIAFELGFNEANYFSKVFKKITGQSPSEFRREQAVLNSEKNLLIARQPLKSTTKWIV